MFARLPVQASIWSRSVSTCSCQRWSADMSGGWTISMSMSLSSPPSPRAVEPNTDACTGEISQSLIPCSDELEQLPAQRHQELHGLGRNVVPVECEEIRPVQRHALDQAVRCQPVQGVKGSLVRAPPRHRGDLAARESQIRPDEHSEHVSVERRTYGPVGMRNVHDGYYTIHPGGKLSIWMVYHP